MRLLLYTGKGGVGKTTTAAATAALAAERGLLSLAAFLYLIALAARRAYVGLAEWRGGGGGPADLHLGVLGALAAFAVAALFENNWGDAEVQRVILMLVALPFVATLEPESA